MFFLYLKYLIYKAFRRYKMDKKNSKLLCLLFVFQVESSYNDDLSI